MKYDQERDKRTQPRVSEATLAMNLPICDEPLLEGPGEPVPWAQFMAETAAQTNYWLEHFGKDEVLPPPWEERFVLD
jgi:hypothetical protein